jgi:hypothetical protein
MGLASSEAVVWHAMLVHLLPHCRIRKLTSFAVISHDLEAMSLNHS